MDFNIAQTPTLQAVAASGDNKLDEQKLVEDLQQRADAAALQADAQAEVIAAAQAHEEAATRLAKLRQAERGLHQYAKKLREKITNTRETALDALIESFGDNAKPDAKALNELTALELRGTQVSQAIARLVEQRLPLAQIAALREESHAMLTKTRALEQIAQERAERLLEHLRDAVNEEVVLPVDLSKGVSGLLLHQAAEYKTRAIQISESADQLEKTYLERARV